MEPAVLSDDFRQRLERLDSCALSDALDTLRRPGATTGLAQLWPSNAAVVGRVRTVQAGPRTDDRPGHHIAAAAIDDAVDGDVLVIANGGRLDVSCFGGILAVAAVRHGVRGIIVDGACRDIGESAQLDLPVYGRAVVPVSARGRIAQLAMDEPISVAGVTVAAGDIVLADREGVVFVTPDELGAVLDLAERITSREAEMADAVRAGRPVAEVMHDTAFPTVSPIAGTTVEARR